MGVKDELKRIRETVDRQRDEIRLQLHLARQDAKDEWDDLEEQWDRFRNTLEQILRDTEESSQETRQHALKMGDELKQHYERLRKKLR